MKTSLVSRLAKLEQFTPVSDEAQKFTRILIVGPDEYIEVKLPGHPSQREYAQMTFHKTPSTRYEDTQGATS